MLRDLRAQVAAGDPRDFEARVKIGAANDLYEQLTALGDGLREALGVSYVDLERADGSGVVSFEQVRADGEKCARCWKFRELGSDQHEPMICTPCANVVRAL